MEASLGKFMIAATRQDVQCYLTQKSQNKLSFMSSKSNRVFFITVKLPSFLVFPLEENQPRLRSLLGLANKDDEQRSAGIFIAVVPYTITRSSCPSHKSFCRRESSFRIFPARRGRAVFVGSGMTKYNRYMFLFIWNKLNATCSP